MSAMTSWSLVREAEVTAASASSKRKPPRKVHIVVPGSKGEATSSRKKTRPRNALRKDMTGCSAVAEAAAHDGEDGASLGSDGAGKDGRIAGTPGGVARRGATTEATAGSDRLVLPPPLPPPPRARREINCLPDNPTSRHLLLLLSPFHLSRLLNFWLKEEDGDGNEEKGSDEPERERWDVWLWKVRAERIRLNRHETRTRRSRYARPLR
jgi:hypothetical protein